MKKSIYDVYVTVTSQEQADRLKGICLEYGLPIWNNKDSFLFINEYNQFSFGYSNFWIQRKDYVINKTQITESDFIQLAKEFKQ